jgi:hypothetical protein
MQLKKAVVGALKNAKVLKNDILFFQIAYRICFYLML